MVRAQKTIDLQLSELTSQAGMLTDMLNMQTRLLEYDEATGKTDEGRWNELHTECLALTDKVRKALEGYEVKTA